MDLSVSKTTSSFLSTLSSSSSRPCIRSPERRRQLLEAILIDKKSKDVNLNSKNEYFSQSVKRIGLNSAGDKEECGYCGRKFAKIDDLQTHEENFHTKSKCNTCDYVSFGKKDLAYHTQNMHP